MSANPALIIDALLSACQGAPALDGVTIIDGPRLAADVGAASTDRLFIGASDDGSGIAADGENQAPAGVHGVIDVETFSILCVAEAWSGSASPSARRARAFEIRDAVRALVRPNPAGLTLGMNTLSSANVAGWQLIQIQASQGFYAGLTFRVDCTAKPSTN